MPITQIYLRSSRTSSMIIDMNEDISYAVMAWVSYTQRKVEQSFECLEDVCKSQKQSVMKCFESQNDRISWYNSIYTYLIYQIYLKYMLRKQYWSSLYQLCHCCSPREDIRDHDKDITRCT